MNPIYPIIPSHGMSPMNQGDSYDTINLLDYWNVIWKRRKLIIIGTLSCMIVAGVVSFTRTRLYKAQATFFITQKGQVGKITQTGDRVSVVPEPSEIHGDILTQMVKSCELAQMVMEELSLSALWQTKRSKDCESTLRKKVTVGNVGPKTSGVFSLSVLDKDPQLAYRITESYLRNLQELNTQISTGTARRFIKFIEDRLVQAKEDLSKAEEGLREFKMKYSIAELKRQGEVTVNSIGDLQSELSKAETNLKVLESQFTERDPEVIRTRTKINEIENRIRQYHGDKTVSAMTGGEEPTKGLKLTTIRQFPELSMKLGELEQKTQIQNDIYRLLMVQYESAKIESTKQARIIQVIDKPTVPEDPEPRKALQNTMIAAVVGFMLTVMIAFLLEYLEKNRARLVPSVTVRQQVRYYDQITHVQ